MELWRKLNFFGLCYSKKCGTGKVSGPAYKIFVSDSYNDINQVRWNASLTSTMISKMTDKQVYDILLPNTLSESVRKEYLKGISRTGDASDWISLEIDSKVEKDFMNFVSKENAGLTPVELLYTKFTGIKTDTGRHVDFGTFLDFINSLDHRFAPK